MFKLITLACLVAAAPADLPPLNRGVLEFAREQVGKTVGDGQCTELASEALRHAGARRFPFGGGGDYVWGRPVDSFADALPGDVLQFRDAVFQGSYLLPGGRRYNYRHEYPHHTAVVAEVRDRGRLVTVLHQNVAGPGTKKGDVLTVRVGTIRPLALKKGGRVRIYRPVSPDEPGPDTDTEPERNPLP